MPAKRPIKPILSSDSLFAIQHALDARASQLEQLHWSCVAFGATQPVYANLQSEQTRIARARSEVGRLFEAQFPPVKP